MKYPEDCITAKDKTEYLYIVQEKLREEHNDMVTLRENGIISLEVQKKHIDDDFMPRSAALCREIAIERSKLSKINRDEIIGTTDENGLSNPGTKNILIKSKRWLVVTTDIREAKKVEEVAIG